VEPSFQKFLAKETPSFSTTTNRTDLSATICLFFSKWKENGRKNIRNNATAGS
jgi:hypothetical protein